MHCTFLHSGQCSWSLRVVVRQDQYEFYLQGFFDSGPSTSVAIDSKGRLSGKSSKFLVYGVFARLNSPSRQSVKIMNTSWNIWEQNISHRLISSVLRPTGCLGSRVDNNKHIRGVPGAIAGRNSVSTHHMGQCWLKIRCSRSYIWNLVH